MNRRSFFAAMAGAPVAIAATSPHAPAVAAVWSVHPSSIRAQYLYRCFWSGAISAEEARRLMNLPRDPGWRSLPAIVDL